MHSPPKYFSFSFFFFFNRKTVCEWDACLKDASFYLFSLQHGFWNMHVVSKDACEKRFVWRVSCSCTIFIPELTMMSLMMRLHCAILWVKCNGGLICIYIVGDGEHLCRSLLYVQDSIYFLKRLILCSVECEANVIGMNVY